jgi:uncharacterized protein with GYD domain
MECENIGGEVKAFYGVLGAAFDTLFIVDAPDEEAVARMSLAIAALGNVRTSTHRAFPEEAYRRIVSGLP